MDQDVKDIVNSTTLGPYSFQAFVAAAWTSTKVETLPAGRRALESVGNSHRKRPLASDIAKTNSGGPRKKVKNILKSENENTIGLDTKTRSLRNGKKIFFSF